MRRRFGVNAGKCLNSLASFLVVAASPLAAPACGGEESGSRRPSALDTAGSSAVSARLNPYPECLPASVARQAAARWEELFEVFVAHSDQLHAVTLWGVSDAYSWLNNWPVNGRTNYVLLFDRQLQPKQSWQRVIEAAGGAR